MGKVEGPKEISLRDVPRWVGRGEEGEGDCVPGEEVRKEVMGGCEGDSSEGSRGEGEPLTLCPPSLSPPPSPSPLASEKSRGESSTVGESGTDITFSACLPPATDTAGQSTALVQCDMRHMNTDNSY